MRAPPQRAFAAAILLAAAFASRPAPPTSSPEVGSAVSTIKHVGVSVSSIPFTPSVPPIDRLPALLRAGDVEAALALAATLPDTADRAHWTLAALRLAPPELLAAHALARAAGPARTALLDEALARWTLRDPAATAEWIARHLIDAAEFDRAIALLVQRTDTVHRSTATALEMAENLADPDLRLNALAQVAKEWSEQNPSAALHYVLTSPDLSLD